MRHEGPRRLLGRAWLGRHLLAGALVVAFLALGWWQIGRAAGGNALSWAYAVEWPVFAGFVIFVWVREVQRELRGDQPRADAEERPAAVAVRAGTAGFRPPVITRRPPGYGRTARPSSAEAPAEDAELSAYNDYLAWLNDNPDARPGDYPGRLVAGG